MYCLILSEPIKTCYPCSSLLKNCEKGTIGGPYQTVNPFNGTAWDSCLNILLCCTRPTHVCVWIRQDTGCFMTRPTATGDIGVTLVYMERREPGH
jgi:hypothetical protein